MLLPLLLSCAHDPTSLEGDDAEECRDGADNDQNGRFDCADAGCAPSPDCGESDTDAGLGDRDGETGDTAPEDTDSGEGDTAEADAGAALDAFASFSLVYSFTWDFDDGYAAYLEAYGIADCVSTYTASGARVGREGLVAHFVGPWQVESTDCGGDLETVVWTNDGEDTFATFTWGEGLTTLEDWVEHDAEADAEPVDEPSAHKQWYITEMGAGFAGGSASYDAEESVSIDIIPVVITHHVEFTFLAD